METVTRKARWPRVVAILVFIAVAAVAAFVYLIYQATTEVRALAPWPSAGASAEDVATVELEALGLSAGPKRDARDFYGPGASFSDGVSIEYSADGVPAARITVLYYASNDQAASDFQSIVGWANQNCGWSVNGYLGASGVLRCGYSDGHNRILWSGNWILDIEAADRDGVRGTDLADQIRDATAAHWKGLGSYSPTASRLSSSGAIRC